MNKNQRLLGLLILVFITPPLLGAALFFGSDHLSLQKNTTNYGTLIQPPQSIQHSQIQFQGKWTLLMHSEQNCNQVCADQLQLMHTIRLLMNDKMRRIQTVWFYTEPVDSQATIPPINHTISISQSFAQQLPKSTHPNAIFLVDPLGNVMMRYEQAPLDVKRVLKDLGRLLKYSRVG